MIISVSPSFSIQYSMLDVRVSRRRTALSLNIQTVRFKMNLILPERVRPRSEIAARTRIADYKASATR